MTAPLRRELLPCPFCGGEASAVTGPVKDRWGVTCEMCDVFLDCRSKAKTDAIKAWNTRTTQRDKTSVNDFRQELAKAAFAFIEARQLRSPEAKRRTWDDLPPRYQRDYLKHADQLGAILAREIARARAEEREAAAKLCDDADKSTHPADLAAAIRARGGE